ncbi:unnamed protein product, partial [Scytosiphon promiscuus]
MRVGHMMYPDMRRRSSECNEASEGWDACKGRNARCGFSSRTRVFVAPAKFKHETRTTGAGKGGAIRRVRMPRRCGVAAVGKGLFWFLLALLVLSGPLCPCAAAAASQKTYYSVLGVEPGVSEADLRRAYRRAAVKWHPDKNTGNVEHAEKKFKEIQKAYDTLRDPRSRGDYDGSLRNPRQPNRGAPSSHSYGGAPPPHRDDAGDFFSTSFYTRMREQAGGT